MLIDEAKIYIRAGNGSKGTESFYRSKRHLRVVGTGGDGGKGADIVAVADADVYNLLDLRYHSYFKAKNGQCGSSNNKKGRNAQDLIIRLPVGTVIKDVKTGCFLVDLDNPGKGVVLAKGGRGGRGNSRNRISTDGEPGQEKELFLELKQIADVVVVGLPNCGKSTLICALSNARSKIADYPFTTKGTIKGMVKNDDFSFTVMDIPALIEGSSQGRGLGNRFLRHLERAKIILHLIDMPSKDAETAFLNYRIINKELRLYEHNLTGIPQIIAANKMDLAGAESNLEIFRRRVRAKVYLISALKKQGLEDLVEGINRRLQALSN